MKRSIGVAALAGLLCACLAPPAARAEPITLKASHQFPGGKGDVRDEMVQMIAREVAAANVGLEIKVFPGSSLVKAQEQWKAMQTGQIDMTSFPLDYASGFHPAVRRHADARPGEEPRACASASTPRRSCRTSRRIIEQGGAKVLADAWLAGAFGAQGQVHQEARGRRTA